ncbi:MAG TPA: hypothetical protein VJR46_06655, partial [Candidatus Dormibacteraeota bacterium]|nr:hypothetical protein [Candidatus Dormibacteraeota bacterium]
AARRARQAVGVAYAALALALLAGGAAGLPPAPSVGARVPPANAVTSIVNATSSLGGVTITIDQVAFDHRAGATWLHATLVNSTTDEIEWTVPPVVSTDGASANGEYRRSTQLPGDVDAGQRVSGWLFVPLDPASVRPGGVLHVRFVDVAMAGYRTVGDVNVEVKVAAV